MVERGRGGDTGSWTRGGGSGGYCSSERGLVGRPSCEGVGLPLVEWCSQDTSTPWMSSIAAAPSCASGAVVIVARLTPPCGGVRCGTVQCGLGNACRWLRHSWVVVLNCGTRLDRQLPSDVEDDERLSHLRRNLSSDQFHHPPAAGRWQTDKVRAKMVERCLEHFYALAHNSRSI